MFAIYNKSTKVIIEGGFASRAEAASMLAWHASEGRVGFVASHPTGPQVFVDGSPVAHVAPSGEYGDLPPRRIY